MAQAPRRLREQNARYVATLVYLDEPQVVLLDHGVDAKIIGVAIEREGFDYPFFGCEITANQYQQYKREFFDLQYLFTFPVWREWYFFDLAKMDEKTKAIPLEVADKAAAKNVSYLPSHGFWARSHTAPDNEVVVSVPQITKKHRLDGTWQPIDISKFFSRASDLYSFYTALRKLLSEPAGEQIQAIRNAFTEHPFRGGSSYVNFYKDLREALSFEEQLAFAGIEKNSPGFVQLRGQAEALEEMAVALKTTTENFEELENEYNTFHGFLSGLDLLTRSPDQIVLVDAAAQSIRERSKSFADKLGIDHALIDVLTGFNPLSTAKILLSHFRRLRRYFFFYAEGRVQPGVTVPSVANSPSRGENPGG
jgi:hypothetical protein